MELNCVDKSVDDGCGGSRVLFYKVMPVMLLILYNRFGHF